MVAGAVFAYYGVPFLLDFAMPGTVAEWQKSHNVGAIAILGQFRVAGLMLAVPRGILLIRDIFLRFVDGDRRKRDEFSAVEYCGPRKEPAAVPPALVYMTVKCWHVLSLPR